MNNELNQLFKKYGMTVILKAAIDYCEPLPNENSSPDYIKELQENLKNALHKYETRYGENNE